jgi:hypothetical protein
MRKFWLVSVFSLLVGFAGAAKAYVHDFGVVTGPAFSPVVPVPACLVCGIDTFDFTLTAPSFVTASASNVYPYEVAPVFTFPTFAALLNGALPFLPIVDGQNLAIGPVALGIGMHTITVTGSTGPLGGAYIVSVSAVPVPEPSALLMMLAGLLGIGTIVRRRGALPAAA